eukprot:4076451-Amphidinium_carterae.2
MGVIVTTFPQQIHFYGKSTPFKTIKLKMLNIARRKKQSQTSELTLPKFRVCSSMKDVCLEKGRALFKGLDSTLLEF